MEVGKHLITNILQKIKSQVPTLTKEDIITALNIIYITCAEYNFNYVEKYGWPKIIHQFTLKILFLIKIGTFLKTVFFQ